MLLSKIIRGCVSRAKCAEYNSKHEFAKLAHQIEVSLLKKKTKLEYFVSVTHIIAY